MRVLLIAAGIEGHGSNERRLRAVATELKEHSVETIFAPTWSDALAELRTNIDVGSVVLEWEYVPTAVNPFDGSEPEAERDIKKLVTEPGASIPGILITGSRKRAQRVRTGKALKKIERGGFSLVLPHNYSSDTLRSVASQGTFGDLAKAMSAANARLWKSAIWVLQRIREVNGKLPVFLFTDCFTTDGYLLPLDVFDMIRGLIELGSLLEHSSVVGLSEANAARVFGADSTFFVTNGTSTSNKMVYQSCVAPHDLVLLDRNSHKSSIQAIQQCDAWPIFLRPVRNSHGILGPVPLSELNPEVIQRKLEQMPHPISTAVGPVKLLTVTNSTYDGICYNVPALLEKVGSLALSTMGELKNILFDEAWSGYAHFSNLFEYYHAMSVHAFHTPAPMSSVLAPVPVPAPTLIPTPVPIPPVVSVPAVVVTPSMPQVALPTPLFPTPAVFGTPTSLSHSRPSSPIPTLPPCNATIFATQSTHKVLAALSQASMVHVRNSRDPFFAHHFNSAYMANTSTSPQYGIIASLDISVAMMDLSGRFLVGDTIKEAVAFRKKMGQLLSEHNARGEWWFSLWQPPNISKAKASDASFWVLPESSPTAWHGFPGLPGGSYMLDPLKVTFITSHLPNGKKRPVSIPALVLARALHNRGLVFEKTGFFTALVLFTIGVTKGSAGTLILELTQFKRAFDANVPFLHFFPELAGRSPLYDRALGIRDLCEKMLPLLQEAEELDCHSTELPRMVMTPGDAYRRFVQKEIDWVPITELENRISATLVCAYPPGIPVITPGEIFSANHVKLFNHYKRIANEFPGFETEVHGIITQAGKDFVACVKSK